MIRTILSNFWHRTLRQPYHLAVQINEGKGQPVIFLHGIASDYRNWITTAEHLPKDEYHVIVPDLLGHGSSPKPSNSDYSAPEHARQIVAMMRYIGLTKPAIIVGHSMGALIAVEVARQRPDMVKELVLCGMPIYETSKKWRVSSQTNTYFALYRLMLNRPEFTLKSAALAMKMLSDRVDFTLTKETWHGFQASLENTIIKQTTYKDIQDLQIPVVIIRGTFDMLAPARPLTKLSELMPNITLLKVKQPHEITKKYALVLAQEIQKL